MRKWIYGEQDPNAYQKSARFHNKDEPVSVQYSINDPSSVIQNHSCERCGIELLPRQAAQVMVLKLEPCFGKLAELASVSNCKLHPEPPVFSDVQDISQRNQAPTDSEHAADGRCY